MSDESDRPRRRGKAASKGAVAIDPPAERGLLLRALLYSPKDLVAGLIAFAAVSAIISHALFMQAGRHPSPMFGSTVVMPLS
ncbi:MAG: peptidoglycan-binding protein, partial [Tardiphaga sp.]|nr:peptidoglycan-binding protein [Tardiphaga sp.]